MNLLENMDIIIYNRLQNTWNKLKKKFLTRKQ